MNNITHAMSRPALRFSKCALCCQAAEPKLDDFVLELVNVNDPDSHLRLHSLIATQRTMTQIDDTVQRERDDFRRKCDEARRERDIAQAECNAARHGRDYFRRELDNVQLELLCERDKLRAERDKLRAERDKLQTDRGSARHEIDSIQWLVGAFIIVVVIYICNTKMSPARGLFAAMLVAILYRVRLTLCNI
jgi:Spy/CpxP family protein refolding chaperone